MAIVIGSATTVSFQGACVISANWSFAPNPQRLFCIGSWDPDSVYYRPTESLSLTIYAPGSAYTTTPTTTCEDANTVAATITPVVCGDETATGFSGNWLVNSYSFTKEDATMPGQESWSLTRWKDLSTTLPTNAVEPTWVMRGISEGQGTLNAGISFSSADLVNTETGSVSAGGFGRFDALTVGVVESVGGGTSTTGETGQGSASMPYTPLYI